MKIMQSMPAHLKSVQTELKSDRAYLLPLRLFMGLGWLRTGTEKVLDPEWLTGGLLTQKLQHQLAAGEVYFPFYELLLNELFLPNALIMAWIILIGEFLVGLGIMFGTFTSAALLGALFMNVNFVLAGWVNPSAFYIVIQLVLLTKGAGLVLGGDRLISRYVNHAWLVSRPTLAVSARFLRVTAASTAGLFVLGLSCLFYVRDFTPGGSVEDPAMLLSIMSMVTGMTMAIFCVRAWPGDAEPEVEAVGMPLVSGD